MSHDPHLNNISSLSFFVFPHYHVSHIAGYIWWVSGPLKGKGWSYLALHPQRAQHGLKRWCQWTCPQEDPWQQITHGPLDQWRLEGWRWQRPDIRGPCCMLKCNEVILWAKRFFWKDPRRRETHSELHSKADALGGRQTMMEGESPGGRKPARTGRWPLSDFLPCCIHEYLRRERCPVSIY